MSSITSSSRSTDLQQQGVFHCMRGTNVRLANNGTVAFRSSSSLFPVDAMLFTEQPMVPGKPLHVKLIQKADESIDSIRIGVTTQSPDEMYCIPDSIESYYMDSNYWILQLYTVHHDSKVKTVNFNLSSLREGDSVGCSITRRGQLHFYWNEEDKGTAWTDLPRDKPIWMMIELCGSAKIESLFLPTVVSNGEQSGGLKISRLFGAKKSPEVLKLQEEILHFHSKLSKAARTDQERKAELLCLQKTIVRLQEEIKDFNFREGKGRLLEEITELKAIVRELENESNFLKSDNERMKNEVGSLCDEVNKLHMQLQQSNAQLAARGGRAYSHQSNQSSLYTQQPSYNGQQPYHQSQGQWQQAPYGQEHRLQPQPHQSLMPPEQLQAKQPVDLGSKDDISFWVVSHHEVQLTDQRVGEGGWGTVSIGLFRGQEVAVKQLHAIIGNSDYCKDLVRREIGLMAKVRHPNLLLFIAAVLDTPKKSPIIITELMETNLRIAYENNRIVSDRIKLLILKDVSTALNYLHLHIVPIVHRDVSSANVLLQALPDNHWRGKLSDFGSANLAGNAITPGPGSIAYSAPEALKQGGNDQSPKMDVYSYGVLLCEVLTSHFPYHGTFPDMKAALARKWPMIHDLVSSCTIEEYPNQRPSMSVIVDRIRYFTTLPL